ncbi:MAG: hypothetical protein VX593_02705 [Pseudomonadota bacterium]|nr:hypothetical protein [Pseudomonadota bacterium]
MKALYEDRRVLWMPLDYEWSPDLSGQAHCCTALRQALAFDCDQHSDPFECGDNALVYHPLFREYGLIVKDGGMSYVLIDNCPFCGKRLPDRRRDWWFDEVERLELFATPFDELPDYLRA